MTKIFLIDVNANDLYTLEAKLNLILDKKENQVIAKLIKNDTFTNLNLENQIRKDSPEIIIVNNELISISSLDLINKIKNYSYTQMDERDRKKVFLDPEYNPIIIVLADYKKEENEKDKFLLGGANFFFYKDEINFSDFCIKIKKLLSK